MTSNNYQQHGRTQTAPLVIDLPFLDDEDEDEEDLDQETSRIDNTEGRHQEQQQQQQPAERRRNQEESSVTVPVPPAGNVVQEHYNRDTLPRHSNAGQHGPIIVDLPSEDEDESEEGGSTWVERQIPVNKEPIPEQDIQEYEHEQGEEKERTDPPTNDSEGRNEESENFEGKEANEVSGQEANSVTNESDISTPPLTSIILPAEESTSPAPDDDKEPPTPPRAPPSPIPPQPVNNLDHLTPSMQYIKRTAMGYAADSGKTLEEGKIGNVVVLNNSLKVGSSVTFDKQQRSGQVSGEHIQDRLPYPIEERQKPGSGSLLSYSSFSFRFYRPNTRGHGSDNCRNLLVIFLLLALVLACIIGGVCGSGKCSDGNSESNPIISSSSFPSQAPSLRPSFKPSLDFTGSPTTKPSLTSPPDTPRPTLELTPRPTEAPTSSPTVLPSPIPTTSPSSQPTVASTPLPTVASPPTEAPTAEASITTRVPISIPVVTPQPSATGIGGILTPQPGTSPGIGIGIGK